MRVAIVGCGTAGAAAAVMLHDLGHEVQVYERFESLEPVGAGILLQPTGMAVLRSLGLLEQVLARGARVERLHGVTVRGRVVLDMAYGDWRRGLFGLGIHRHILFSALWEALTARGIAVSTGVVVDRPPEGFDLVLGCDGARSAIRSSGDFGLRRAKPYPWGALWAIVDDPADRYAGALAQVYRGTREMIGFLPSGRPDDKTNRVSIFWSLPADRLEATRAAGLDAWKANVRELAGDRAEPITEQITAMEQLLWAGYHDVVLRRLHSDGLALLGDAAHAMSPQLGQGANLALVDAWTLADCLRSAPSLAAALPEYTRRRRAHLRYYAWASRLMTPAFQSRLGVLAPPRDLLTQPLARVPWLRGADARLARGRQDRHRVGARRAGGWAAAVKRVARG